MDDTFEKHKADITKSLEPIENQLGIVDNALKQLDQQSTEINDQRAATETEIQKLFQQVQKLLEERKVKLITQLDQFTNQKIKNLTTQKVEVETVQTQLVSCLSFVSDSLRTGSRGEIMKMKKTVMKQIKEMTDSFKPEALLPCEPANMKFIASSEHIKNCTHFGEVYLSQASPEKCYATGKGLKIAEPGERTTVVLHINCWPTIAREALHYTSGVHSM